MQARIWDLDARFHGRREDSGNSQTLVKQMWERKWEALPGIIETVPIETVVFKLVEVWVPRGAGHTVCWRWVRPEFGPQFAAHLWKIEEQRRKGTREGYKRALRWADRLMNPPRFMPTIGGGEA